MPKHTFETDDELIEAARKLGLIAKPKHAFDSDAEFFAAADKRATKKVKDAVDEAVKGVLARIGVESEDEIDEKITAKLKGSEAQDGEVKKLQGELKKTAKERDTEKARADGLHVFRSKSLKSAALIKHAAKVADPEALEVFLAGSLTVGDDDSVIGPDGKAVDKVVDELLAAKPYLKAPDYKDGAGSKSKDRAAGAGNGTGGDGKPITFAQATASLAASLSEGKAS